MGFKQVTLPLYIIFPIYKVERMMPTLPTSQEAIMVQKDTKRIRAPTPWKHSHLGWLGKESGASDALGLLAVLTLWFSCSILMAGILPFGAMFIELFFIFSVSTAACSPAPTHTAFTPASLVPTALLGCSCCL